MKAQAQERYGALESEREQFLDTGRECAVLTLPYLLTENGLASGERLHKPWQSVGAKGVNVLASKMMLSLFPVNTTFFKLQINDVVNLYKDLYQKIFDVTFNKIENLLS
mgnify:CR=1 FL=1